METVTRKDSPAARESALLRLALISDSHSHLKKTGRQHGYDRLEWGLSQLAASAPGQASESGPRLASRY